MGSINELKEYVMPGNVYKNTRANSLLVKKYFPLIYESIKDDYKTKLYMLLHDIKKVPKCVNINCNNDVKLENIGTGFRKFCCKKCLGEHQHLDKDFSKKISNTKKSKTKQVFLKSYNIEGNFDRNYVVLKNYCKHGDVNVYRTVFNKLLNISNCLCENCNDEFISSFTPTNENFITEKENLKLLIKDDYYIVEANIKRYYPKIYKCIKAYGTKYNDTIWAEELHMFLYDMQKRPTCIYCNEHEVTTHYYLYFSYNQYCNNLDCRNKAKMITKPHNEIFVFLCNYIDKKEIFLNYKLDNIIVDIYVPSKKLVVEYNSFYWHREEITNNKYYYFNRHQLCKSYGLQLINVWEDDWLFKQDIIKSMLLNKVGINDKIHARKCEIKEISQKEHFDFCEKTHIQGGVYVAVKLGLYRNDELISVMSFGNISSELGKNVKTSENEYELIRFCSRLNTTIIGGASKLFNYFLKTYRPSKVRSFANCDISNGNLYKTLGFKEIGYSDLNYWWVKNSAKHNRYNYVKHKLSEQGVDNNKSENQIMEEGNFFKIWGTGNLNYEYNNVTSLSSGVK
jgi:hypothetical protein